MEGSRTADRRQEQDGGGPDKIGTEHEGWMDIKGGWTWDMGWMELETTREGDTTPGLDRENQEERHYKEEISGKEQNKDEDKNGNKKESKDGDTNQDIKIAKGCRKPAITNRTDGKKEGIGDKHQQTETKHHKGPDAAPGPVTTAPEPDPSARSRTQQLTGEKAATAGMAEEGQHEKLQREK